MNEMLQPLNNLFGSAIGMTLLDPSFLLGMVVRFILNTLVVCTVACGFYYRNSKRRDYMFIFIIMSISIFLLVSLMGGDGFNTGAALGLFAIFGIIRYRTESIPIREMTYLFMLVAVSVVNALGRAEYHPKSDYWEGVGLVTLLFANLVFICLVWIYESNHWKKHIACKYIKYDNIALITPDKESELIEDLKKRTGLQITGVEVGAIDFLKDAAFIKLYYISERDNTANTMRRLPRLNEQ